MQTMYLVKTVGVILLARFSVNQYDGLLTAYDQDHVPVACRKRCKPSYVDICVCVGGKGGGRRKGGRKSGLLDGCPVTHTDTFRGDQGGGGGRETRGGKTRQ